MGVVAAHIAFPVGVVGNVGGWNGDGVGELRVWTAWSGPTEERVEGYTGGAVGVYGEKATKDFPEAGRAEGVFLN